MSILRAAPYWDPPGAGSEELDQHGTLPNLQLKGPQCGRAEILSFSPSHGFTPPPPQDFWELTVDGNPA